jgi:tetratricopeptide (TPR) repeat protein
MGLLLVAAFLCVAALKVVGSRPRQMVAPAAAAQRERVRQFWATYRKASQEQAAGRLESAIDLYGQAVALKPDHEDSLYYLGNCYLQRGRHQEAASTYQRLIEANRVGSSRGYVQLALVHADRDAGALFDPGKADRFFQQALEVDPDSGALLGIGEVALLQGQWQKAREALEGVNAENAMSVAAPYLLGYLHWRSGEREEAWRWFTLAIQHCRVKKPPVPWSEEGDLKAAPELRWRALARQSVFGDHWLGLRAYLNEPNLSRSAMEREYRKLHGVLGVASPTAG